jgi:hypothetical protein
MGKFTEDKSGGKVFKVEIRIEGDAFYQHGGAITPYESEVIEVERILAELVEKIKGSSRLEAYRNLLDINGHVVGFAQVEVDDGGGE